MTRILLSCGEASGDLYAGALITALRRRDPDLDVFGLGSDHFAAAGGERIADFHGLSVTGLTEALAVIPRSLRTLKQLVSAAAKRKPHVAVLIDYPDFNFRLMARLKRLGIPVVYYISPQLWAWRASRITNMKRGATRVLPIFPFEETLYRKHQVPVTFVGHPLIDLANASTTRVEFLGRARLDPAHPVVALLPGSRTNELERIAPVMAQAVPLILAQAPGTQFVVARAPNLADRLFEPFGILGATIRIVEGQTDDVLNGSDAVVTASGTATVQTALHGKPMVVLYKLSPMTYRLGRRLALVDMYAMVNLIAGRRIVVELIQDGCTPEAVATETTRLLTDSGYRSQMVAAIEDVKARLGGPGASDRAAAAILEVARANG